MISTDVIIESADQEMLGGVHAAVNDEIRDVPEVGTATRLKCGHWKDGKMTSSLTGIDPDRVTELAGIRMVEGDVTDLNGGGVVIAERVALDGGLTTGDRGADLPVLEAIAHA